MRVIVLIVANKAQAREVELLVGEEQGDNIHDALGRINVKHDAISLVEKITANLRFIKMGTASRPLLQRLHRAEQPCTKVRSLVHES